MCKVFNVIGISDSHRQYFSPNVLEIISNSKTISGGKRHHEIVMEYLPENSVWIDVTVPLEDVFKEYSKYNDITVFASGDPLFFGFAATLQREFSNAEIRVFPSFNSLQMLAHRIGLPYQDMVNVSITGRPWKNLDDALISGYRLIGCLTDRKNGPAEMAFRMLEYGYDNYQMYVGTSLGNEVSEKVECLSLKEAISLDFGFPNCVILKQISKRHRYFGIPESEFFHLNGREKMITKMPIRLLSLSMLDLPNRKSLWDVGFCTGSVSVEARLQFPHLDITSFEIREECLDLIEKNSRKFGTPDIDYFMGDFLDMDLSNCKRPDAVFIGGHGGKLLEILEKLQTVMLPGCVVVFNSVNQESCDLFRASIKQLGMHITLEHNLKLDSFNPITILKAE